MSPEDTLNRAAAAAAARAYKSDFARYHYSQGWARGYVRGMAAAVESILEARGMHLPERARDRVSECTDLAQLKTWVRRAGTVDSMDELFER
jgi:hypothetical protein